MTERSTTRRRPGWLAPAAAFVLALAICSAFLVGRTGASYTDRASAVIEAGGSYDITLEAQSASTGEVVVDEGKPDALLVASSTADAVYTKVDPVVWDITVHNVAAAGTVAMRVYDPVDEPFTLGATVYPDVYSRLLFTITDTGTGTVLANGRTGAELATSPVTFALGDGESRALQVSVLLDQDTWSVYNKRTTTIGIDFQGATS